MKNRLSHILPLVLSAWLAAGLSSLAVGCSSNAPPVVSRDAPLGAEGPLAEPTVAGAGSEDPDATETNFITFVCVTDSECRGEERCIFPPVADAGAGPDAGVVLGRCKVPVAP